MAGRSVDQSPKPFQGPWEGESKIVIGIDIGTTQSGVAFAFLQQGANQSIHRVVKWPGQQAQNQQGKIPTVVWYDSSRKAVSFGAEAVSHEAENDAEDYGWQLAKHFKLHLHPRDMQSEHGLKLDQLPAGVSLRQVYSDFLGYLLLHTKSFFEDRILDGRQIWAQYKPKMEVVIAHPNGWGIREQAFLREVAVTAGFADAASASTNIRFVTEAEASVHYCIYHTNLGDRLKAGMNFIVCDAGGSTVDTTLYSVTSARPVLELKEKRASACVQAGAIFVDAVAEGYLRNTLKNAGLSSEDVEEYTKAGIKDFEGFAKRVFRDDTAEQTIAIAHSRFNSSAIRTRRGRMTLPGSTVKSFFDICAREILQSVDKQVQGEDVSYILLVGGFGDSPFLRREFKERYEPRSHVTLTNDSTSKAVADGAVIWNTISSVLGRAAPASIGTITSKIFDPDSPEHQGRTTFTSPDGNKKVSGHWCPIVSKGDVLDNDAVCRESFYRTYSSATPNLTFFTTGIISYSGDDRPKWARSKQGPLMNNFRNVCTITANLNNLSGALEPNTGVHGRMYWSLDFDVCIRFGGTEWQAYLKWTEDGVARTGPASLVPFDTI